jgi:predicted MFS family arabinose efflux permease
VIQSTPLSSALGIRKSKLPYFILEGFNAFATGFYFNWLFFFTQNQFHFGVRENLGLVALHGLTYTGAALFGGRFAHRFGNFRALKCGFAIMILALGAGAILPFAVAQLFVLLLWTFGMCFTWPTFQSLVSAGESSHSMQRLAGFYNIVWSGVSAISYFAGGALLEKLGPKSLFWLPMMIHIAQLGFVLYLEAKQNGINIPLAKNEPDNLISETPAERSVQKKFLRFALLTNPFAYVAINTAIPIVPVVAHRFNLSPTQTGIFCSIWFFVRMGAFILFSLWRGWHYRFGFLLAATILLVVSFLGLLLAPHFWILLAAQIVFGLSVGLIYYSSLYYSMHGGNAESEHGGLHEAMIGCGTFLGAIVGVIAKYFFPNVENISVWAVSGLLAIGLFGLIWLHCRKENG